MSMSTHIVGIMATDDYKKKLKAYTACCEAGIEPPEELYDLFEGVSPEYIDPDGSPFDLSDQPWVSEYRSEMKEGFTIEVEGIPKGLSLIKVYNSY